MRRQSNKSGPSRISRNYSIISLACLLVAILTVALIHRQNVIHSVTVLGEKNNLVLSRFALDLVKPELLDYLNAADHDIETAGDIPPLPEPLAQAIQEITDHSAVVRVKIYNRNGVVVFSTETRQIALADRENPTFQAAMKGRVSSKLHYRDALSKLFLGESDEDNLIESYLPVRRTTTRPIMGVFEIYENVRGLISDMEREQMNTLFALVLTLLAVYFVLLMLVNRADRIIEQQRHTIGQRTEALETLSAQLLTAQEDERSRLANYLHEELAQDLSAMMIHLEHSCNPNCNPASDDSARNRQRTLGMLQESIRQVRSKAMELRPPSLSDFGLVPTITWFVREMQSLYPALRIETQINVKEDEIPKSLKTVIYRIVQETLQQIGDREQADNVRIYLRALDHYLTLAIDDNATAYHPTQAVGPSPLLGKLGDPTSLVERTLLSGGTYSVDSNQQGGTVTRATWPLSAA